MNKFNNSVARYLILLVLFQSYSTLCVAADYSLGVTSKVLTKTSITGNGRKIVYPSTDNAEVTAMLVEIAPGAETGWHKHSIPVYAYIISGNLDVEIEGGSVLHFKTGDPIIEVLNTPHNGKNNGRNTSQLVVFYTGMKDVPNVIK